MGLGYFGAKKSLHRNDREYMDLAYFGAMRQYNPFIKLGLYIRVYINLQRQ